MGGGGESDVAATKYFIGGRQLNMWPPNSCIEFVNDYQKQLMFKFNVIILNKNSPFVIDSSSKLTQTVRFL